MRRILVVGAGQSGLQLALCLLAEGYDVTVMSARTPDQLRGGFPMSTQGMFGPALALFAALRNGTKIDHVRELSPCFMLLTLAKTRPIARTSQLARPAGNLSSVA